MGLIGALIAFIGIPLLIIAIVVPCKVYNARQLSKSVEGRQAETIKADKNAAMKLAANDFTVSATVATEWASIFVDDIKKHWCLRESSINYLKIFRFKDLVDFDLNENGFSVINGSGVGVGIGSIGPVGIGVGTGSSTVRGVCTILEVRIRVNDIKRPEIVIQIWEGNINKNSDSYKRMFEKAREFAAVLSYIINNRDSSPATTNKA